MAEQAQDLPEDAIAFVFPADRIEGRFVFSVAMATNDLRRSLEGVLEDGRTDSPDFSYRVRLSIGHLVEAIDSLNDYCNQFDEVRRLIRRVPSKYQADLRSARASMQRVGDNVLQNVRHYTFHYPSPATNYAVPSDEVLRGALETNKAMSTRLHVGNKTFRFEFADEMTLAMTFGTDSVARAALYQRAEIARDAAIAYQRWAQALIVTYFKINGIEFGEPERIGI